MHTRAKRKTYRSKRRNENNFLFQRDQKKRGEKNFFELSHVASVAISVIQL